MIEVYRAQTFSELITLIQNSRSRGTSRFSYRQLADKLGYRSPRTLAMIHKGQRLPNQNLVRKIIFSYGFSPQEIELTLLLAEKAITEKKQLPVSEIEKKITEKIETLKKNADEPDEPDTNLHLPDACLYLDSIDLDCVRNEIGILFNEWMKKYSVQNSDKVQYRMKLKVSIV